MNEKTKLIESLKEYIEEYGWRSGKLDKVLPIDKQNGSVYLAMELLDELTDGEHYK